MLHTIVLILHVLGAGIVFGVVFFSILAVIKPSAVAQQIDRLRFVSQLGMFASAWQFVTGVMLYLQHPDELKGNHIFWAKLAVYVIEGAFASFVLGRQMRGLGREPQSPMIRRRAVAVLVVHAILITAIIVLGVVLVEQ